jgi:hypothetical protein
VGGDEIASALKTSFKILKNISREVAGPIGDALKIAAKNVDVSKVKSLSLLANKLSGKSLDGIGQVVRNSDDALRLARYVEKYGDEGLNLVRGVGKWIGKNADEMGFAGNSLTDHLKLHKVDTGIPWLGREFKDTAEYLEAAREVIRNPGSKKVMYYHQGVIDPKNQRLGYLLENNGNVFLASVNKDGFIATFHRLNQGWDYLNNSNVFAKLFELY